MLFTVSNEFWKSISIKTIGVCRVRAHYSPLSLSHTLYPSHTYKYTQYTPIVFETFQIIQIWSNTPGHWHSHFMQIAHQGKIYGMLSCIVLYGGIVFCRCFFSLSLFTLSHSLASYHISNTAAIVNGPISMDGRFIYIWLWSKNSSVSSVISRETHIHFVSLSIQFICLFVCCFSFMSKWEKTNTIIFIYNSIPTQLSQPNRAQFNLELFVFFLSSNLVFFFFTWMKSSSPQSLHIIYVLALVTILMLTKYQRKK